MYEIFSYNRVKERLFRESYSWERVFNVIEKVITVSEIMLIYPKNLYKNDFESVIIYFFCKTCIYYMSSLTNGRNFEIIALKPDTVSKFKLENTEHDSVILTFCIGNDEIILSSKDDTSEYHSYKYAEALLEIVKIYTT